MKTLFLSTVAALAFGSAANATDFVCGSTQFAVGKPSVDPQDTVVRTEVRHSSNGSEWLVNHYLGNGRVVSRQDQYTLSDTSRNGYWSWRGQLRINSSILMIGEMKSENGQTYYYETQYANGGLTLKTRSVCNQAMLSSPPVIATTPEPQLSPAEKRRQAAQNARDAAKALAEAQSLEAETLRIKAEAEAASERKKNELAAKLEQDKAEHAAKLERDKVEQAAQMERDKAEHAAKMERDKSDWIDKLDTMLGPKAQFERMTVPLKIKGNSMRLLVGLGDQTLTMVLDTGATSSLITHALASSLVHDDLAQYIGMTEFKTSSGEIVKAKEFVIKEVKIGSQVVRNVKATVVPGDVELLLGVNVLNTFGLYAIDSKNNQLIFAINKTTTKTAETN